MKLSITTEGCARFLLRCSIILIGCSNAFAAEPRIESDPSSPSSSSATIPFVLQNTMIEQEDVETLEQRAISPPLQGKTFQSAVEDAAMRVPKVLSPTARLKWKAAYLKQNFDPDSYGDILTEVQSIHERDEDYDKETEDERLQRVLYTAVYAHRMRKAWNAKFKLSGTVVDDSGNPLDDIDVRLVIVDGLDVEGNYEERKVDRNFSIEPEATIVTLYFSKRGYYKDWVTFESPFNYGINDVQPLLRGKNFPQHRVVQNDLRMVLQKEGSLTKLHEYLVNLHFNLDRSGKVIDFAQPPPKRLHEPTLLPVKDVADLKQLPKLGVFVTAKADADGQIRWDPKLGGRPAISFTLHSVDPAGGFIRYLPLADHHGHYLVDQSMKQAPADGYQREFTIDHATDAPVPDGVNWYTLYFRVGNNYGRANIIHAGVSEDGKQLLVRVKFLLQPDGSRNLETEQ